MGAMGMLCSRPVAGSSPVEHCLLRCGHAGRCAGPTQDAAPTQAQGGVEEELRLLRELELAIRTDQPTYATLAALDALRAGRGNG